MSVADSLWFTWWNDADIVVRAVFVLLVFLSLLSWTVIVYKARQLRRLAKLERAATDHIAVASGLNALKERLSPRQPLHVLVRDVEALSVHPATREMVESQLNQSLRERLMQLESGLTVLASIGNAAPFIGLFGTVWGIMHALHALGGDTALALDAIAGPVSEALVATAAGIFTAVPAVMGYNLLVRRLRHLGAIVEGNAVRLLNGVAPARGAHRSARGDDDVPAATLRGLSGGRG